MSKKKYISSTSFRKLIPNSQLQVTIIYFHNKKICGWSWYLARGIFWQYCDNDMPIDLYMTIDKSKYTPSGVTFSRGTVYVKPRFSDFFFWVRLLASKLPLPLNNITYLWFHFVDIENVNNFWHTLTYNPVKRPKIMFK